MPVWKTTQADQFYVMCQEVKYYNMVRRRRGAPAGGCGRHSTDWCAAPSIQQWEAIFDC